ncbi:heat shock protein Hsp20 [Desulfovibrio sp. X2]|uniref:Hsp20/alpha crystallin family protein n=1 Tax=Desulfovibrio sp. X2 TaxID=941449 RepID=UPI00035877DE|nr:Hsp20/alpha crystallin family protein [Desulfovibrio sp. X2]EPR41246.1 heat shock protein Hsp20 [Desulfovibrio sp. X2]
MSNARERKLPVVRPATDILEKEDGFHIFMDLPGVSKEALVLDLRENELVVSGSVDYPPDEKKKHLAVEFGGGEYSRTFTLADIVDRERITANLVNGVLEIFMPKREKEKPKRIEIVGG